MDGKPPTSDELRDRTRRQARQSDELRAEVERLNAELEQSRRAGKRPAAPFSQGVPKPHPKRPGRTAGHPPSHRPAPPPEQVDRIIEVPLPPDCPGCHAPRDQAPVAVHDPDQIDRPEPQPIVTRFRGPVARGPACFRRVLGRHPEQTSDALGAAAVPYGPRLLGFAADLKHRIGASDRTCSSVLWTHTGRGVAAAALVRSGHRRRRLALPSDDRLAEAARHRAVQHVEETGGKSGGRSAWLGVFADAHATLDRIRKSRGHEGVVEVLGEDDPGVLVSDCFPAYDPLNFPKGQCSAHVRKRCSESEQSTSRGAVRCARRVAAVPGRALAWKRRRGTIGDHGDAVSGGQVQAELDRLWAGTSTDPDHARLAQWRRAHRDRVLRFLDPDEVGATNNLGEREGRPAVLARTLAAGNRTEAGAEAHAVLASVCRTYRRQGREILEAVVALLRHGPGHVLEFDPIAPPVPAQ